MKNGVNKMKILVTGGLGFIGSNFIEWALANTNFEIFNLNRLSKGTKPLEFDGPYQFIPGDINDPVLLSSLIPKVNAIINFAAETHVDRSILSAGDFVQTDVLGTYTLLEAVKKHKIGRYIQISTDEIYGSIEKGAFTEDSTLAPNSPYAASKAGGDLLVCSYFKTYKLPIIITRSSNNYGPYHYPEKIIPFFITNALQNLPLPLYGDGKNIRDWLYVKDNCKGLDTVFHKGREGEIYNIGGEAEKENIEITKIILSELGKNEDLIKFVKDRPGHDRRYALDCSKIKKLGWKPEHSFEDAIKKTVKWYKDNKNWWIKIKEKQKEFIEFQKQWYYNK